MLVQLAASLLLDLVMPDSPTDEVEWWYQQRKIYILMAVI